MRVVVPRESANHPLNTMHRLIEAILARNEPAEEEGPGRAVEGVRQGIAGEVELEKKTAEEAKEPMKAEESDGTVPPKKVMSEEQAVGVPKLPSLPLDVLLEIGGFIAGENNYGTLLSFSLMSKTFQKEMDLIFYETMFVWDTKDLAREPGTGGRQYLDAYKYTRFVYTRHDSGLFDETEVLPFPNLRLTISLDSEDEYEAKGMRTGVDYYKDFPVRMSVNLPIGIKTLMSLFRYPVNRKTSRPPQPIRRVHTIAIWAYGAVIGGDYGQDVASFRNQSHQFSICLGLGHEKDKRLSSTVHVLGHLLPILMQDRTLKLDGTIIGCSRLGVTLQDEVALDAWLDNLPTYLAHRPRVVQAIFLTAQLSVNEFFKKFVDAASVYAGMWDKIKHEIRDTGVPVFFDLEYSFDEVLDGALRSISLRGRLRYDRTTGLFTINVVEDNKTTGESSVLLDKPYVPGGNRA